jgi:DNA-binding NtrC family response regulator
MPTRVLLVEDDILTRRNIATYFLRRPQIEVEEAPDGEEAVRLITSIDEYDVLVSVLRMPRMTDGMDVIACQQRISPGTGCILVTAFGSDQLQKKAQALSIVYLEKPLSLTVLVAQITDLTTTRNP